MIVAPALPDRLAAFLRGRVTGRRADAARLFHAARRDPQTGLPNRMAFDERLQAALAQLGRQSGFALLAVDVDRFGEVVAAHGARFADALLRQIGERLQDCAREVDTVARMDGDHFAVIQAGVDGAKDVARFLQRVQAIVASEYVIDGARVQVGLSIGVAIAPTDSTGADGLLKCASLALTRAKAEARGGYRFFEPEMDARLQARRSLEADLRQAVMQRHFTLAFQPLFDIARDGVTGFEALLRWQHPTRGSVSPADFIPVAEEMGLIAPLGAWVLERACAEAARWPAHVKVAVNVSPLQFRDPSLYEHVARALSLSGLPPARLELEITESALLDSGARTVTLLHRIKALGVGIAMDDFGTGYASLSTLNRFPFDRIKIDQSFVRDIEDKPESRLIVRAIAGLGASLGMQVTAEGVETAAQLHMLRAERCTEVQGYYFSAPRPAEDIRGMIQRWMVRPSLVASGAL